MTASVDRSGGRLAVTGNMTMDSAAALLAAGMTAMGNGEAEFDLAAVQEVDSAGLAVLFGWQRAAQRNGKSLRILNPPQNLTSLAEVYGVSELLPLA